jgi:hypothetical protein
LFRTGLNGFCGEMQPFPRFAACHSRVVFIRDIGGKLRGRLCNAGGVTGACGSGLWLRCEAPLFRKAAATGSRRTSSSGLSTITRMLACNRGTMA